MKAATEWRTYPKCRGVWYVQVLLNYLCNCWNPAADITLHTLLRARCGATVTSRGLSVAIETQYKSILLSWQTKTSPNNSFLGRIRLGWSSSCMGGGVAAVDVAEVHVVHLNVWSLLHQQHEEQAEVGGLDIRQPVLFFSGTLCPPYVYTSICHSCTVRT